MYLTIDKILEQANAAITAAEAHGIAAGMLCVNGLTAANTWLQEVLAKDFDLTEFERVQLNALFEQTQEVLNAEAFAFELFLPNEQEDLSVRIDALKHWCLGYLSGIGFTSSRIDWSGDSGEILRDIVECSRLDVDTDGDEEEDELAFTELQEYIRVGVQVIRGELMAEPENNTLH